MKRLLQAWNRTRGNRNSRPKNGVLQRRHRERSPWSMSALEPRLLLAGDVGDGLANTGSASDAGPNNGLVSIQASDVCATTSAIVFIDSRVEDIQTLQTGLIEGAELVLIDLHSDALEQISLHLQHRQNIASLHLVSHGSSGQLLLGNQSVDEAALLARSHQIRQWSSALTHDADILVYGCNTGAGTEGTSFATRLAKLTGADVALSTDKTGSVTAIQTGNSDWDLERHVGSIESPLAFDKATQRRYANTLALTEQTSDNLPTFVPVIDEVVDGSIDAESTEVVTTEDAIVDSDATDSELAVLTPVMVPVVEEASDTAIDLEAILELPAVRELPLDLAGATQLELSGDGVTPDAVVAEVETTLVAAAQVASVMSASIQATTPKVTTGISVDPPALPVPTTPEQMASLQTASLQTMPVPEPVTTTSIQPTEQVVRVESSPLPDLKRSSSTLTNSSGNLGVVPTIHTSAKETIQSRVSCFSGPLGRATECEKASANAAKTNKTLTTVTPKLRSEIRSSKTVVKTQVTAKTSAALPPSIATDVTQPRRGFRSTSKAVELDTVDQRLDADVTIEKMVEDNMSFTVTQTQETPSDSIDQPQGIVVGGSWAAWASGTTQKYSVFSATTLNRTETDRTSFTSNSLSGTSSSYRHASDTSTSAADSPTPKQSSKRIQGSDDQFGLESPGPSSFENVNLNSVNTLRESVSLATIGHSSDFDLEVAGASSDQLVFENTAVSSVRWLGAVTELQQLAWNPETAGSSGSVGALAYLNPISRYTGD